jgi:hypothetical protein
MVRKLMKNRVLFSLLIIFSSYAAAQRCTTSVLVNAFDARTRESLHGLRASDFAASAGRGDELKIENVRPVFRNRVLVLLDLGGANGNSSAQQTARTAMLQNAIEYINEAPQEMPVAFGAFAEGAVFTSGFSSGPESLSSSMQSIAQRATGLTGNSNLTTALLQALAIFGQHRPGDTILLISNGNRPARKTKWNALAREFARRETRIQLLMNTPATSVTDSASIFSAFTSVDLMDASLLKLANGTGGVLMGFMNSEWYNVAASGYLLDIRESQRTKSKNWHLQVRNYGDEFGVTPVLFYPRQLPACSASLLASAE